MPNVKVDLTDTLQDAGKAHKISVSMTGTGKQRTYEIKGPKKLQSLESIKEFGEFLSKSAYSLHEITAVKS